MCSCMLENGDGTSVTFTPKGVWSGQKQFHFPLEILTATKSRFMDDARLIKGNY